MARIKGRSSEQTRESVLQAATEAFAHRGFSGTSLNRIGETAGVTAATLSYHFGSKEDLYRSVVDRIYDDLERLRLATAASDLTDVAFLIETIYNFAEAHRLSLRVLLREIIERGGLDPTTRRDRVMPITGRIAQLIAIHYRISVAQARRALVTLTLLIVRFAINSPEDNQAQLDCQGPAQTRAEILSTLVSVATHLLHPLTTSPMPMESP